MVIRTNGSDEVLTLREAAERLCIDSHTLETQIRHGVLAAAQSGPHGPWLVTGSEVERYGRENVGKQGTPRRADDKRLIRRA